MLNHSHRIPESMPVIVQSTPMLSSLSSVGGKTIEARCDGACMSCNGGLLTLRELEQRLAIASRLAGCIRGPCDPSWAVHGLDVKHRPSFGRRYPAMECALRVDRIRLLF